MKKILTFSVIAMTFAFLLFFGNTFVTAQGEKPTEIKLVQTPGQFEPKELTLKAGQYVFNVVNQGIDHKVGFYLQVENEKGKKVKNSDTALIGTNKSARTGVITLKPGKYVYSCPLNPTPHYVITVQ